MICSVLDFVFLEASTGRFTIRGWSSLTKRPGVCILSNKVCVLRDKEEEYGADLQQLRLELKKTFV